MANAVTLADGTVATVVDGSLHIEPPEGFSGDGQKLALAASQDPVVQALLGSATPSSAPTVPGGFNYSGNPGASALDYIRFTLGDVNAKSAKFSDAEINAVFQSYGQQAIPTILGLCDVLVSRYTAFVDESVGSVSMAYGQMARNFEALGDRLRAQFGRRGKPWAGGIDRWDVRRRARDPSRVQPKFAVGMYSTSTATLDGRGQDYDAQGGWYGGPGGSGIVWP